MNKDVLNKILYILDSEISIYRKLLDINVSEYEYLVIRDYDSINKHIELKENFYSQIINLEEQRDFFVNQLAKSLGLEDMSMLEIQERIIEKNLKAEFASRREVLKLLITRITESNENNKQFLDMSRAKFNEIIDNFKELINKSNAKTNVYSDKGRMSENGSKKESLLLNKEA